MIDHVGPKDAGWFNDDVIFVVFPNFGQFGKFCFLPSKFVKLKLFESTKVQSLSPYRHRVIANLHDVKHFITKSGKNFVYCFWTRFRKGKNHVLWVTGICLIPAKMENWIYFLLLREYRILLIFASVANSHRFVLNYHFLRLLTNLWAFCIFDQLINFCDFSLLQWSMLLEALWLRSSAGQCQ